jgi:hypothetical protein
MRMACRNSDRVVRLSRKRITDRFNPTDSHDLLPLSLEIPDVKRSHLRQPGLANSGSRPFSSSCIDSSLACRYTPDHGGGWTCPEKVPDTYIIYAAILSNARGLLPANVECLRRGL